MNAFGVVEEFEREVAKFCGAPYCVATSTGTAAIFLALRFELLRLMQENDTFIPRVECPAKTFVSVPHAILQAGFGLRFVEYGNWRENGFYQLDPTNVIDSALLFERDCYVRPGALQCLSFQARKSLPIGEGGAILTDSTEADEWLRRARYSGRDAVNGFDVQKITEHGFQLYMTPEKAARGLHLLQYWGVPFEYPDLRETPYFKRYAAS